MDVPMKETARLLDSSLHRNESTGIDKVMGFIEKMDPERKDSEHMDSICPRMLLNHTARIPESMGWKKDGDKAWDIWGNDPQARFDADTIMDYYEPTKGFNNSVEYSNGNTVIAGMFITLAHQNPLPYQDLTDR